MAETVKPLIVLGEALSTGIPTSPALEIPGVTNITSETIDYGYQKSQDIEDAAVSRGRRDENGGGGRERVGKGWNGGGL
ncbi:MAG: hypothetical protein ACI4QJ_00800 [Candidatus Spyradenecus sp.]